MKECFLAAIAFAFGAVTGASTAAMTTAIPSYGAGRPFPLQHVGMPERLGGGRTPPERVFCQMSNSA